MKGVVTKKQIEEWKAIYKNVYLLSTEDGKEAYLFDPFHDFNIAKMVTAAMLKDDYSFIESLLANCWLAGDESIKLSDDYLAGLIDQAKDLIDIPDFVVEKKENIYHIQSEGEEIQVRPITRADSLYAERRNTTKAPYETAVYLLEKIAIDKDLPFAIKTRNVRAYIGILVALDKAKDKKEAIVKKL